LSQPSPEDSTPVRHRERRWLSPLLVAPLPIALLALATVHPSPRAFIGILAAGAGAAGWYLTRKTRRCSREAGVILLTSVLALIASAASFIPIGPDLRSVLQPGLAQPVNPILELAGVRSHPIALDPHEAALAWGWAASCVALCIGIASALRTRRRSLRLAAVFLGSGAGLVLLQLVQVLSGAEFIYWVSGIPLDAREPFFGTFVNPNHAGILLAAILPMGLALVRRGEQWGRILAGVATGLVAMGLWLCGSRGALIAASGGLYMMGLVVVQPRTRLWMLGVAMTLALIVLGIGPEAVFVGASEALVPESVTQDSWSLRPEIWSDTVSLIAHSPWVGVGIGGFETAFPLVKSSPQFSMTSHAHGESLQVIAETGILPGLLWILAVAAPAGIGWRHAKELGSGRRQHLTAAFLGSHTALLIGSLFDFPFRIGAIALMLASVCGILLARPGTTREAASSLLQRLISIGLWICTLGCILPAAALLNSGGSMGSIDARVLAADQAWEQALEADDATPHLRASESEIRSALAAEPLDHRLLQRLARVQIYDGLTDEALYTLSLAQRAYPTLPWPWFAAAKVHSSRGELESARHAWHEGLSLDLPSSDEGMARVLEALADAPSRAAVLAMLPRRADRLRDAAAIVSNYGDRSLARRLFQSASELDPRVNLAFANHLVRWGETEEAWRRIQLVPNRHCNTVRTTGSVLLELERPAEAMPWLEEALGTCGAQDSVTLYALARARVASQDPDSLTLLERLLRENPQDLTLLQLKAQSLRDLRRYADLIPILEELVLEDLATSEQMDDLLRLYEGRPLR
jgi:O-antigen ligase/tetratricopeptide (TPR) repeat protein